MHYSNLGQFLLCQLKFKLWVALVKRASSKILDQTALAFHQLQALFRYLESTGAMHAAYNRWQMTFFYACCIAGIGQLMNYSHSAALLTVISLLYGNHGVYEVGVVSLEPKPWFPYIKTLVLIGGNRQVLYKSTFL